MSAPERNLRFTPAARQDLRNIALYTRRVWGDERHASYRTALERAFKMLLEHPQAGRPRDDLVPGWRSINVKHHVIFYHQPDPTTIVVRRILHGRQDPGDEIAELGS